MTLRRSLRILFVSYPLLAVTPEVGGGAEQILIALEREMARRGHQTMVAAPEGSCVAGSLFSTGPAAHQLDRFEERNAEQNHRVKQLLAERSEGFEVIHDHSGHFWREAAGLPVLATLHLSADYYGPKIFRNVPQEVSFNCVSEAQRHWFSGIPRLLGVVRNGIDLRRFPPRWTKQEYLLWLGRICEEKGTHVAIRVAQRAGLPLVIAGQVYPFSYHQRYLERQVKPLLNSSVHWVEAPCLEQKRKLLQRARALLVTSAANETSSVVAMEAAASGTPVIAFRRGALPEVVRHGLTGFVVDSENQMVEAIGRLNEISPRICHKHACGHFSSSRMADEYEQLYASVLGQFPQSQAMPAA